MPAARALGILAVASAMLALVASADGWQPRRSATGRQTHGGQSPPGRAANPPAVLAPKPPRSVTATFTSLIAFDVAPFPYYGRLADAETPFFDVRDAASGQRGHTTTRGDVYWEAETYRDRRVLLHIPAGFNSGRPALIIVYFHGQGATLERDVLGRQQVARQVTESGLNAVLVAPQFALDAADSSSGNFWRPGVFARFLDEAAVRLAALAGEPGLVRVFRAAPVVLVAYSGGYQPAAYTLDRGGADHRLRGVILLDALYGQEDKFAHWIAARGRSAFFASVYTESTLENQQRLRDLLRAHQIPVRDNLNAGLEPGIVLFTDAGSKDLHNELVTQGWVVDPVRLLLSSVSGYRRPAPQGRRPTDGPDSIRGKA